MPEIQVLFIGAAVVSGIAFLIASFAKLIRAISAIISAWREFKQTRDKSTRCISQLRFRGQNLVILLIGMFTAKEFVKAGNIYGAVTVLTTCLFLFVIHKLFMPRASA